MQRKKVCVIGTDGVGKTSIILRKIKNHFSNSYLPTLGCDFYEYTASENLSMFIWDIAAQSAFKEMQRHYLSFSHLVAIVFDINRFSSEYIDPWVKTTLNNVYEPVPIVLVLNKIDLLEDPQELKDIMDSLKERYNHPIIATSAKTGEQIEELFGLITKSIV